MVRICSINVTKNLVHGQFVPYIFGIIFRKCLIFPVSEEEERSTKKRDSKSREKKRDRKDKGYRMFEEEDSEEELVIDDTR